MDKTAWTLSNEVTVQSLLDLSNKIIYFCILISNI